MNYSLLYNVSKIINSNFHHDLSVGYFEVLSYRSGHFLWDRERRDRCNILSVGKFKHFPPRDYPKCWPPPKQMLDLVNGKFLDLNQGYFYYKATRTF